MSLISFEGFDGLGKTTLISQLMNKYPLQLYTMPFPSDPRLYDYSHDIEKLDDLLEYHTRFLYDFIKKQDEIQEQLDMGKTVLLDRYFYSNFAYLVHDFKMWMKVHDIDNKKANNYIRELKFILYPFYKELIQPDMIIYLQDHIHDLFSIGGTITPPIKDIKYRINQAYELMMEDYGSRFKYFYVLALRPNSFEMVESVLIDNGYIKKQYIKPQI